MKTTFLKYSHLPVLVWRAKNKCAVVEYSDPNWFSVTIRISGWEKAI